jgi:hypothetical protein
MSDHPDHTLIGMYRSGMECETSRRRLEGLIAAFTKDGGGPPALQQSLLAELETWAGKMLAPTLSVLDAAADTPALSQDGLRAKAELLAATMQGRHATERLSFSVAMDTCRLIAPQPQEDPRQLVDILAEGAALPLSGTVH